MKKAKNRCELWKQATFDTWWLPYEHPSEKYRVCKDLEPMRYCNACDKVYEVTALEGSSRKRIINYYSQLVKRFLKEEICPPCRGVEGALAVAC